MKQNSIYKMYRLAMIFFFVFVSFCAIATEKAELKINISDCRGISNFACLNELKILKNGKEFKILKPQHVWKQVLNELDLGTYTLVFKSIFNKEETVTVDIIEYKQYSTNLCTNFIDYSKETYIPIIDKLQVNDNYTIVLTSQGCFHSTKDLITIKRNKDGYSIIWGTESKILSSKDIDAIRHFEIELNYMTDGGCTTTDTYIITFKGKSKQIDDGSCTWNGDNYLKKLLFGTY